MDYGQREQSQFDMGMGYLTRMNSLLYNCNSASISLDVYLWYHSLSALYRELSTRMDKKELEAGDEMRGEIHPLINKHHKNKIVTPELYTSLDKFEMFLRKILKDSGLEMKMQQDPSQALQ